MDAFEQARALQQQGKHQEALPLFQQAVSEHPQSYVARTNLSYTYLELGRFL